MRLNFCTEPSRHTQFSSSLVARLFFACVGEKLSGHETSSAELSLVPRPRSPTTWPGYEAKQSYT